MSLLGAPLPSATYAGTNNGYYAPRDAGGALVGVQSLNSYIGNVAIVGDATVGITNVGSGQIQVSTNGKAQNVASLNVSGAISGGAGMTLVGSIQSAGVTTGGITCSGISSTGNIATVGANDVTSTQDVVATRDVTASRSLTTSGNAGTNQIVSGSPLSILGFDNSVSGTNVRPVSGFVSYAPQVVTATGAGATYTNATLNALLNSNGAHLLAFTICSPVTGGSGAGIQSFATALYQVQSSSGTSGGAIIPAQVSYRNSGWTLAISGNGTGGSPLVATFTASGGATDAGVITITQLC